MAWPKGKPRPANAGRKKGSLNKRTRALQEALSDAGCSFPDTIAQLLANTKVPNAVKAAFLIKLMPYLYPQRRPVDPEGYVTIEQVAGMLGAQAARFRAALARHVQDQNVIAQVLADLRSQDAHAPCPRM